MIMKPMPKFEHFALNVLRIAAALLWMQHGAQKLFGWFGGDAAELVSMMGLAGVIEFLGGLLLLLGLFTRPVAIIAFLEMVAAYFIAHASQALWPIENRGELALLYAVVFLYIAARGPGAFSLDHAFGWYREREAVVTEGRRDPV